MVTGRQSKILRKLEELDFELERAGHYIPLAEEADLIRGRFFDGRSYEDFASGKDASKLDALDETQVDNAIKDVEKRRIRFWNSDIYQQAVRAWKRGDRAQLLVLIPQIFEVIPVDSSISQFYHGVDPKPKGLDNEDYEFPTNLGVLEYAHCLPIPVKNYVDRIQRIKREGLKPSAKYMGDNADENLQAVFCTEDIHDSFGIVSCRINYDPLKIPIFRSSEIGMTERCLYCPLCTDFDLVIPDEAVLVPANRPHSQKRSKSILEYRDQTIAEMSRRNIPFTIIHLAQDFGGKLK
jgi:hypothetical protein